LKGWNKLDIKPNVLVFVTDQHRADWLSCMGNQQLQTPNIDAIAARGTTFTRAYCNTPLCMPSRATMWNGLHASAHGLRTNGIDMDDIYPTLPQILHDNGYKTISVGKIHLRPWHLTPEKSPNIEEYDPDVLPECETVWNRKLRRKLPDNYFGLDVTHFLGGHGGYCFGEYLNWLEEKHPDAYQKLIYRETSKPSLRPYENYYSTVPHEVYYNQWISDLTIEEMKSCDDQPFFMWCSFPDPHFPFGPPAPYNEMFSPEDISGPIAWDDDRVKMNELYHMEYYTQKGIDSAGGGPTNLTFEQIQETKALAWGLVKSVDDSIGQVMAHLKKSGKLENTIVVFLADHGELMGDHGLFCKGPFHYEGLLKIPMIISVPQSRKKGVQSDALVSIVDFMPTILDLTGAAYPDSPLKEWQGVKPEDEMYKGVSRLPGKSLSSILSGEQNTIQDSILIENDDDIRGVFLRTLVTRQYKITVYSERDYGELFDLKNDPEECNNLWYDPESQVLKAELIIKLLDKIILSEPRLKHCYGCA